MSTTITSDNGVEIKVAQLGMGVVHPEGIASIWARLSDAQRIEFAAALDPGRRGLHVRLDNQAATLATYRRELDAAVARAEKAERERDAAISRAQQPAQAVTRADIEKAIRDEFLDWESQLEVRISRAVNHAWNLVSGDDPAVYVVRESDLNTIEVEQDSHDEWFADGEHIYSNGAEDARNLAAGHLRMAVRRLAVARAIEADQAADPVEELAEQIETATREAVRSVVDALGKSVDAQAVEDSILATVGDDARWLAAHVLGQEADQ